jgi:hypothetical protein
MAGWKPPVPNSSVEVLLRRGIYLVRHIPSKVKAYGAAAVFLFVVVALSRGSSHKSATPTDTPAQNDDTFWDQNYGEDSPAEKADKKSEFADDEFDDDLYGDYSMNDDTYPGLSEYDLPTSLPTKLPTLSLADKGGYWMTTQPTALPTKWVWKTEAPTEAPTEEKTVDPTMSPTPNPTAGPTAGPTAKATLSPTAVPTAAPSAAPTELPTLEPTESPLVTEANITALIADLEHELSFNITDLLGLEDMQTSETARRIHRKEEFGPARDAGLADEVADLKHKLDTVSNNLTSLANLEKEGERVQKDLTEVAFEGPLKPALDPSQAAEWKTSTSKVLSLAAGVGEDVTEMKHTLEKVANLSAVVAFEKKQNEELAEKSKMETVLKEEKEEADKIEQVAAEVLDLKQKLTFATNLSALIALEEEGVQAASDVAAVEREAKQEERAATKEEREEQEFESQWATFARSAKEGYGSDKAAVLADVKLDEEVSELEKELESGSNLAALAALDDQSRTVQYDMKESEMQLAHPNGWGSPPAASAEETVAEAAKETKAKDTVEDLNKKLKEADAKSTDAKPTPVASANRGKGGTQEVALQKAERRTNSTGSVLKPAQKAKLESEISDLQSKLNNMSNLDALMALQQESKSVQVSTISLLPHTHPHTHSYPCTALYPRLLINHPCTLLIFFSLMLTP